MKEQEIYKLAKFVLDRVGDLFAEIEDTTLDRQTCKDISGTITDAILDYFKNERM